MSAAQLQIRVQTRTSCVTLANDLTSLSLCFFIYILW